jgi:hypothetical protein
MASLNWARSNERKKMRERGTEAATTSKHGRQVKCHDRSAPSPPRTLAEVDKFWRDRGGRAIVTRLTEYNGRRLVDVRTYFTAADGAMRPTSKGLACNVRLLPELARAINKARELGLVDDGADRE